jgi:hypothetical protein
MVFRCGLIEPSKGDHGQCHIGRLAVADLPEWDWYDISAHLRLRAHHPREFLNTCIATQKNHLLLKAGNPTEGQNMDERRQVPLDILDSDFWKAFEKLLGSYSLKLEHFHQGAVEYRKTILDEPTDWVELHITASPITAS